MFVHAVTVGIPRRIDVVLSLSQKRQPSRGTAQRTPPRTAAWRLRWGICRFSSASDACTVRVSCKEIYVDEKQRRRHNERSAASVRVEAVEAFSTDLDGGAAMNPPSITPLGDPSQLLRHIVAYDCVLSSSKATAHRLMHQ
eukprot:6211122-Pleurochrysis_carterae.AAC.1